MNQCFSYYSSVAPNSYKEFNVALWDSCVENFEKGEFLQSLIDFLNYLDPNIYNQYSNIEKTIFTIPHGSAVVIVRIENDHLYIETPFVKLPETKFMPILRKSAEINFSFMTLPNIKLHENTLKFQYDMPLELCNPWKLYDILKNITFNADKYDDEFVTKFNAERIIEPIMTDYNPEKLAEILNTCKEIAKETLAYIQHFETKRNLNNAIDSIFIGISRIRLYCEPTGILLNKMNETIDVLYDRSNDLFDKIKAGKNLFTFIETIVNDQFKEYCAITFTLIPEKRSTNRSYLENWIEGHLKNAEDAFDSDDFQGATFYALYALYYILSYFNIETEDKKIIEYGLNKSSEKPWKDASEALIEVMDFFFQNSGAAFVFEEELETEPVVDFDMDTYMKTMEQSMGQYKEMMAGFMSSFANFK
jgi:hypothetical protein